MNEIISAVCSTMQVLGLIFMIFAMANNLRWPWVMVLLGGLAAIAQIFVSPMMLQGWGWQVGHSVAAGCGVCLVFLSMVMMLVQRNK